MAIDLKEALNKISKQNINLNFEIIPIEDSINRICAQDIIAEICLPRFNNSAMDGYGIIFEDKDKTLEVVDTIFAGDDNSLVLETNKCVKIMTGARIPENCSAVIPKEECETLENDKIKFPKNIKKNQHIRFIGEDIKTGDILINSGDEINFAKVTLLASQGISHIKVYKKPKIVVFSSGEELKLHYEKAEEYQIYNSNTPTFMSRCKELGAEIDFVGQAHDSIESIKSLVENSLDANLIITSGGVSVGDADFTKEAFKQLNIDIIFDGIMIKPGKPTVLGKIGDTFILNLPGNPLASALIFELFGTLLMQKLIGSNEVHHNFIKTNLKEDFKTRAGRMTIVPGFFNGQTFSCSTKRSPGMVSTLSSCNSMMVINDDVSSLDTKKDINIIPINWKFFTKDYKDFLTYE